MVTAKQIAQVDLLDIRKELFGRGQYDFICMVKTSDGVVKEHQKQRQALNMLLDKETEEFAYGGAAGGAKSWTGAVWLAFMCLCFPGTRWFVGRQELKALRSSTYATFLKVFKRYGVGQQHWKYNGQDNYFQFTNGSRIDFLEMKYKPSDPYFERFGSLEYTGGWIEEAGEIAIAAFDTIKTRVGRHLNDHFGILGKVFITLNPKKNWVHTYFWKPFKEGLLKTGPVRFLQAFVQDNPAIDSGYIEKLKAIKDKVRKERLLLGNFDYDDDENALMSYDAIADLFTNGHVQRGTKYLTVDVARFGKDTTTIYEWEGWVIVKRHVLKKKSVTEVAAYTKDVATTKSIPMSNVIVDEDGVGGGVKDILRCKGFVNASAPLENPKTQDKQFYENLATQCSYMAAQMVNDRQIAFGEEVASDTEFVEKFTEEAEQVKKRDADSDGKLKVVKKEDIKELIGRSPDDWDTFKMRQYFELKPKKTVIWV